MVDFKKELEIILVTAERECVEKIVNCLKSKEVPSEVLWLKDPNQSIDYIESKGAYQGRINKKEKLVVLDPRLGLDRCIVSHSSFKRSQLVNHGHFFVLSVNLTAEDKSCLENLGIGLIDDTFYDRNKEAMLIMN